MRRFVAAVTVHASTQRRRARGVDYLRMPMSLLRYTAALCIPLHMGLAGCRHDATVVAPAEPPPASTATVEPPAPEPAPPIEPAPSPSPEAAPVEPVAPVEPAAPVAAASLLAMPDANITTSDVTADGLRIAELACTVEQAPLMGTLVIIGSLAKQDRALDRCASKGDAVIVEWSFAKGRARDVVAHDAASKKVDACIAGVFRKLAGPFDARCSAVLLVGDDAGAEQGLARLRATAQ